MSRGKICCDKKLTLFQSIQTISGIRNRIKGPNPTQHNCIFLIFFSSTRRDKKFIKTTMEITVSVIGAKGLTSKDPNGLNDPYCKLGEADASGSFLSQDKVAFSEVSSSPFLFCPSLKNFFIVCVIFIRKECHFHFTF